MGNHIKFSLFWTTNSDLLFAEMCIRDRIYNGIMDEVKLMGYYDNDNDNQLCVDNNDACYKYIRYLYNDGAVSYTHLDVYKRQILCC